MTPTRSFVFPQEILTQHTAVLGKTGSGKTSTAKLLVEQVVAEGARVCVLDPIKSDWWGLTSSADGKKAGLPFHILGGPHGHVPLHASAGKVIGEIVANGALPLSIIDMADFEPGGQAKFFTDFAPTLLRKMRGVVYLVIEEAHLFAPKERTGIGNENLSIHWAKTLSTAGRSKGIRLLVVSQRTQALHNAVLGSCDTMIVHRLTAPADQEPVIKWLKTNVSDKEIRQQVTDGMSSLTTGSGWLCSGEAKIFELVHFPRIHTYDNTATPTGDGQTRTIKTAAVDQDKLRSIIGDAVKEAQANDPRELRKEVARLQQELTKAQQVKPAAPASIKTIEKAVLTDADRALLVKVEQRFIDTRAALLSDVEALFTKAAVSAAESFEERRQIFIRTLESKGFQKILGKLSALSPDPSIQSRAFYAPEKDKPDNPQQRRVAPAQPAGTPGGSRQGGARPAAPPAEGLTGVGQKVLNALAELDVLGVKEADRVQVAFLSNYTNITSTGFVKALGHLSTGGFIEYPNKGTVALTDAGRAVAVAPAVPSSDAEIHERIMSLIGGKAREVLTPLIQAYPAALSREDVATASNYTNITSTGFVKVIGKLSSLGFIRYPTKGMVAASPLLFMERR